MESLHPLVVHFPIALLLTATLVDIMAFVLKRPDWHRAALTNLSLGTIGGAVAVVTGLRAGDVAKHSFEIWKVMELHERLGITTLLIAGFVTALRIWKRDRLTPRVRVITITLMVVLSATLSYGAHLGGRLVYEFGVGSSFTR